MRCGATAPCPARNQQVRRGDRGRKAAELGCGNLPRASYAPSGGELRYASSVLPDRRSAGVQRARPFAKGSLRLSIPDSLETSKPGKVIGTVTSQAQAGVLLAGGWQGRWLLPGSEDYKNEKEDAKSHRDAGQHQTFRTLLSAVALI